MQLGDLPFSYHLQPLDRETCTILVQSINQLRLVRKTALTAMADRKSKRPLRWSYWPTSHIFNVGDESVPALSDYAKRKKIEHFLNPLPKDSRILEIGCGSKWVGEYLKANGWTNYVGVDLSPPADVVGDIKNWAALGLTGKSFDAVIAFEVIEHVDVTQEAFDLLRPGGLLLLTSPVPHMDWAMKLLEWLDLNQIRTSPHSNLTYFEQIPLFERVSLLRKAGLSQWGILRKPIET